MSRLLALALARAEQREAARLAVSPRPIAANDEPADASNLIFGDCGDIGEAPFSRQKAAPFAWPEGVDFHATRDAARISSLISGGAEWRWCPNGGLEIVKDDGLLWALSPSYSRRLQDPQLLPADVLETSP